MKRVFTYKFFWTATSCVLYFFIFSFISGILGLTYWQPNNKWCLNVYALQHGADNPDVLIMGSSTAAMGVYPAVLEDEILRATGRPISAFNVGQFGGNLLHCKRILEDILNWRPLTRKLYVILAVDIHRFGVDGFFRNCYIRFFAKQPEILLSLDEAVASGNYEWALRGFLRDPSNLVWLATENPRYSRNKGDLESFRRNKGAVVVTGTISDETQADLKLEVKNWNNILKSYKVSRGADRAFTDFISFCKNRDIDVLVVNLPIHPRQVKPHNVFAYERFLRYMTKTCARQDIKFYNLQEEFETFGDAEFANLNHLNDRGATIVSEYIARDILLPEIEAAREQIREPAASK